jgi:hypothetical protein
MGKHVIMPPDVQQCVIDDVRTAKYGDLERIAAKYGITKARIYYYRKLAGVTFSSAERSAYLKARPKPLPPTVRRPIRKREGFVMAPHYIDLGPRDLEALRALGYRLNVEEPLKLSRLQDQARAGDLEAFKVLYRRYSKFRLPLAEAQLTPEQRQQLPWLEAHP